MLAQEHSKPQRGKHVLVEKPMATNTEQAQKQLDTAKANGLHLAVGFLMRSSWLTAN
jgi:predicted dehydrogenase